MEQDSFENYIKHFRGTEDVNRENTQNPNSTSIQKKKECENRAIRIVELLMEGTIRPETFLKSIIYLNSSYYQDIVEERALLKLCGYPLCGKSLQPVSKKRYNVSLKNKKVYDLNECGYFCSIYCYNASNHVKNQIDDSPLWLREFETLPSFQLLPQDKGLSNDGVNLKLNSLVKKNNEFTPISSFAASSLDDLIDFEIKAKDKQKELKLSMIMRKKEVASNNNMSNRSIHKLHPIIESKLEYSIAEKKVQEACILNNEVTAENSKLSDNEKETNKDPDHIENSNLPKLCERYQEQLNRASTFEVNKDTHRYRKSLNLEKKSWKSSPLLDDKLNFIKAPHNAKDLKMVNEKIKSKMVGSSLLVIDALPLKPKKDKIDEIIINPTESESDLKKLQNDSLLELKFILSNPQDVEKQIYEAFQSWITLDTLMFIHGENRIKKILDENKLSEYFDKLKVAQLERSQQKKYMDICKKLQLQELLEDKWDNDNLGRTKLQPLPNYSKLKEETQVLDLKVKTFYGGMLYEADDSNFPIPLTKENDNEEGIPAVLPVVDNNSQNVLRRRVLSTAINKGVKFFLTLMNCKSIIYLPDLQDLIKTFQLNAHNVVFQPLVWNYLGFLCLKMLSVKNIELDNILKSRDALKLEKLMFRQFSVEKCLISRCMRLINDEDSFIENYVTYSDM